MVKTNIGNLCSFLGSFQVIAARPPVNCSNIYIYILNGHVAICNYFPCILSGLSHLSTYYLGLQID